MTALAETADRQSLWSSTAGVLNRRVEIARWVTFAFSILGALLAAIASQLNDPQRMYFAIAGAVLLAVVSFVTSRLLGGLQITNWLRARTASEALKREAYRYAAFAKPYDDPLKRDAALNSERERIERDVDDLLASAVSSAGRLRGTTYRETNMLPVACTRKLTDFIYREPMRIRRSPLLSGGSNLAKRWLRPLSQQWSELLERNSLASSLTLLLSPPY
jgi:hypothetical protein